MSNATLTAIEIRDTLKAILAAGGEPLFDGKQHGAGYSKRRRPSI